MTRLATGWAIFQGLLIEALPFLLLGVTIAGLARWLAISLKSIHSTRACDKIIEMPLPRQNNCSDQQSTSLQLHLVHLVHLYLS